MSEPGRGLSPDETHYCTDPTCNAEACNDLDHRTSGRVLSAIRSIICDLPDCDESWCQERAQEFVDGLAAQGYEIAPASVHSEVNP